VGGRLASALGALERARGPRRVRRSRRRKASPGASLLLSVLVHVLLVSAGAAVVWHTAMPQRRTPAQATLAIEDPWDDGSERRGPSGGGASGPAYRLEGVTSAGSLEPLLSGMAPGETAAAMTGLSTAPGAETKAAAAVGTLAGTGLTSGALFSPATGAAGTAHAATAGLGEGAQGVTFAGLGASGVRSVVYVVDGSGPMVTSLPLVIAELERSVGRLSPSQRFGVVVFRRQSEDGPGFESFAPVLVRATPSARQLLHDWLAALEPGGRSSPLAGLEGALALKPDAVFLLSRSIQRSGGGVWDRGLKATMARLEELNPAVDREGRRGVLIQTIQFLEEDPSGVMQAIGTRHGGGAGYRVVKRQQDLGAKSAGARAAGAGPSPEGAGAEDK
jgi:hypothetical protein